MSTLLYSGQIDVAKVLVIKLATQLTTAPIPVTNKSCRTRPVVSNKFSIFSSNVGIGKALMESNIAL